MCLLRIGNFAIVLLFCRGSLFGACRVGLAGLRLCGECSLLCGIIRRFLITVLRIFDVLIPIIFT